MKKMAKKIALLLALCMMCTAVFCGCGSKDDKKDDKKSSSSQSAASPDTAEDESDEASVIGTWGVSEIIDAEGNSQSFEDFCQAQGVEPEQVGGVYTYNEDGSVVVTVAGVDVEGTYEVDGETVTVTTNGTPSIYTYNAEDDTLESTDENTGATSIFVRQ